MQTHILVADEHCIFRNGLKELLRNQLILGEVTEVSSAEGLIDELKRGFYTHLILDTRLSDGSTLERIPDIRALHPDLKIMILSRNAVEVYKKGLRQYDIQYFLSKSATEEDTGHLLQLFIRNEVPGREIAQSLRRSNSFSSLAPREMEIMHHLIRGMGSKAISETLQVRVNTVSTIKRRIFEKTETTNIRELIDLASLHNFL